MNPALKYAKDRLSDQYDRLQTLWRKVEDSLDGVDIPKGVYEQFSISGQENFKHFLCYTKINDSWCLGYAVNEVFSKDPDIRDATSIFNCSLTIRTAALEAVPGLLDAVLNVANEEGEQISRLLDRAEAALSRFNG